MEDREISLFERKTFPYEFASLSDIRQRKSDAIFNVGNHRYCFSALGVGITGIGIIVVLAVLCGLVASGYYSECDPRLAGCVKRPDEVSYYIFRKLH